MPAPSRLGFEDIAAILGRSATAARQLASRGRRRVQGTTAKPATAEPAEADRKQEIVAAFLAVSRNGDFDALLAVLDPDVVLRADNSAVRAGATAEVRGAQAVAETSKGRARAERLARCGLRADRRELFLCSRLRAEESFRSIW